MLVLKTMYSLSPSFNVAFICNVIPHKVILSFKCMRNIYSRTAQL